MIALRPEPQTLLIVVALVVTGSPPRRAAWRAGAWPAPAWITWPMRTSSIGVSAGQAAPLDRRPDGDPAELDRRDVGQRTTELADRRPCGAHEVDAAVAVGLGRVSHRWAPLGLCQVAIGGWGRRAGCYVYSPPSIAITWPVM